jgi:tetratricopeptide (TPR) repeat protein
MLNLSGPILILTSLLIRSMSLPLLFQEKTDTSTIDRQNTDAYNIARKNPDNAITIARQTLNISEKLKYNRGIAESSLALGLAYLAKYNPGDSALYYNNKAYTIFDQINDNRGRALSCYSLAYVYSFKGDLDEAEKYSSLSLQYFTLAQEKRGMINACSALSYLAKQQKDFSKAQTYIQKAIEIARSTHDTLPLADVTNSLGNIYKDMALFKQAIDEYFEALNLWEHLGDSNGISIAYGSIGLMYYYQKEWDMALEFSFKKIPLANAAGDLWEVSKTYNTIAQIYNSKTKYDSALLYLYKGLQLNKEMNYPSGIAAAYHNIASSYLLTNNLDSAFYYINLAVTLAKQIDDPEIVNYYITLGNVYKSMGNYPEALTNTLKAYNMGKKLQLPMVINNSSAQLSDIYSHLNRNDLAYKYLKEHFELSDSISNDEILKRVTRLELQYDFDKKQKEAEYARMEEQILQENRIKQQKLYVKGLLVLFILFAIISLLYIRHNRLRAMYSRIDLEQRLLRAQMNPHFLFNSLCAVQDFILANKPQKANTFLTKIAKLMRNILENSREEYIPLEKEIETIRLYLDLQQLRFETEFDYNIVIDDAIDPENISIPPMLTQPCVENSIEHGLLHSKRKGLLSIEYNLMNGLMMLEVTDNGIGRKKAASLTSDKRKKQSLSTLLTTQRLEHFRKKLREKNINYEIFDLYENEKALGTKVIMKLPYKKIFE